MADILNLIAESYGEAHAEQAASFRLDTPARQLLQEGGTAVLTVFPSLPGSCALMSAMWTALVRHRSTYPIHAVAGSLFVDDQEVFGSTQTSAQMKRAFSESNLDWDGHCWVTLGTQIGDPSIYRTALSASSPPLLQSKIITSFGSNPKLFLAEADDLHGVGIRYVPKHVLTDDEVSSLCLYAEHLIKNGRLPERH